METSLTHKKPTGQSHAFRALKKEEDTFIRPQPPLRAATWWENPLLLLRRRGGKTTLSVNIGTPDSSPRAGTLELAALQFAIALLQCRADTLQREGANT